MNVYSAVYAAHIALAAVVVIPATVLGIFSQTKLRKQNAVTRPVISWLTSASFLLALFFILEIVNFSLALAGQSYDSYFDSYASSRVDYFAIFISHLVVVAVLFALADVANEIRYATSNRRSKGLRITIIVSSVLALICSFAFMVRMQVYLTQIEEVDRYIDGFNTIAIFGIIEIVSWCLHMIAVIAVLIVVSRTRSAARKASVSTFNRKANNHLLAAAIVFFLVCLYCLPFVRAWAGLVQTVLDPLLFGWATLAVLVLVYSTVSKTSTGAGSPQQAIV